MSSRLAIWLTARRELRERARSRAFRASLVIQVLVILAVVVIAALTDGDAPTYEVGVAGADAAQLREALDHSAQSGGVEIQTRPVSDAAAARADVADDALDAALVDGSLIAAQDTDEALLGTVQASAARVAGEQTLRRAGLGGGEIEQALAPEPLRVERVGEEKSSTAIAFVGSLLLYLVILGSGFVVTSSVVEEKTSRVVELILAAIRPAQLLTGKVIGIGILGLVQIALTAGVGIAAALLSGQVELPASTPETVAVVLLYFLLGYALYACAFAVAGALVSRQEDVGSVTAPLTIVLVVGYLASFSVSDDPSGTVALLGTFLPPFAPLIVPVRAAVGELPLGELALSVALTLIFIAGLVLLAGRIYERAVLRVGAPLKLTEGLRLAARR